jgi:hypothetical protein
VVLFKRRAYRRALTELHRFIVAELDHDPSPIEDYIVDEKARAVAAPCGVPVLHLVEDDSPPGVAS